MRCKKCKRSNILINGARYKTVNGIRLLDAWCDDCGAKYIYKMPIMIGYPHATPQKYCKLEVIK